MEKLIELLNQFEKEKKSGWTWRSIDVYDNCVYGVDSDGETEITMYSDLYSKYYGFIKWLVDNDKIYTRAQVIKDVETWGCEIKDVVCYDGYESLLMQLSIQDNPIEFLINILK